MNGPMKFLLMLALTSMASVSFADYSATLYEQGSNKQKELYRFKLETKADDGKEKVKVTYTDPAGAVVVEQNAILDGDKILRDEIDHKQLNQQGLMEVKDKTISFTKTADGNTTTKTEELKKTFVTSANFQKFVQSQWKDIAKGDEVEFRYGVWDRQETVGFEIFKTGEEKIGDQQVLVLKMKPSSFLIAALVKPIIFKFAADGSHLVEMNGRVPPKKKDGTRFKDLDAEVTYQY